MRFPRKGVCRSEAQAVSRFVFGMEPCDYLEGNGWLTKGAAESPEGVEAARLRQPGRVGNRSLTPARGGEAAAHREALKPPPPRKDLRAPERRTKRFRAKRARPRRAAGAEPGF